MHKEDKKGSEISRFDFLELAQINILLVPINIDDGVFSRTCLATTRKTTLDSRDFVPTPKGSKSRKLSIRYHLYRADLLPCADSLWAQGVFAVIGLANYDESTDIDGLYRAFCSSVSRYPGVAVKKLLVIDKTGTQSQNTNKDVFLCFSDECELTSPIIQSHIIPEVITGVFKRHKAAFSSGSTSSSPEAAAAASAPIATPLDYGRRTGDGHFRKQRTHRQRKRAGDYALQAAEWDDALKAYEDAADEARSAGDPEWAAAALEGQCVAIIARAGPAAAKAREDEVLRKAADALALYGKRAAALEGEGPGVATAVAAQRGIAWAELALHLRVARFRAALCGAKEGAAEWLTAAYTRGRKAFADAPEELAKLCAAIAAVFREMGFRRKFAFYAWLAAGALSEAAHRGCTPAAATALAYRTLEEAGRELGLGLVLGRAHDPAFEAQKKATFWGGLSVPFTFGDWKDLQIPTLIQLVGLARQVGDRRLTAVYSMYTLANHSAALPPDAQEDLALEIVKAAASTDHPIDISGVVLPVPNILKVKPIAVTGSYMLVPPKVIPEITWVDSEPCYVDVLISNPLDIEVRITKVYFRTTGPRLKCNSVCIDIPPLSKRNAVLECIVEGEGEMFILGCYTEALGVTAYTPVHHNGQCYTPNEFYADATAAASSSLIAYPKAPQEEGKPPSQQPSQPPPSRQKGRKVTVIGKMPLLDLRIRTSQLGPKHYLYEHETYRYRLDVTNVGTRPIGYFVPKLQHEQGDRCEILGWSEQRCLPLLPEQTVPLTIVVTPHLTRAQGRAARTMEPKTPIQLVISYGENDTGYTRSYPLQFGYNVAPCISVDKIDVNGSPVSDDHFTLFVGLSNNSSESVTVSMAKNNNDNDNNNNSEERGPVWKVVTPAENLAEIAANESSAIVLDFERLVPPKELEDALYSYLDAPGGPSGALGPLLPVSTHRKRVKSVMSSLLFSDVVNSGGGGVGIGRAAGNTINVKGKGGKESSEAALRVGKLTEWVRERAFAGLALRWRSTESAKGEVLLSDPQLTLSMLRKICIAPVTIEILCDGRRVPGDQGWAAETLHELEVVVRNRRAEKPIVGPLVISLKVASQHGDTLPKGLFAFVGPMQASVDEVGPGMEARMKTKFIIMSPGSFTFTATLGGEKDSQPIAFASSKILFEGLRKYN